MLWITRKRVLALTAIAVLAVAAGAYVYFISTGSRHRYRDRGTGSAVTIKGTVASTLYPGGNATVNFTVDNPRPRPSGSARSRWRASPSTPVTRPAAKSSPAAIRTSRSRGRGQQNLRHRQQPDGHPTGTLTMNDTGVSQDACQGATLTLNLTSKSKQPTGHRVGARGAG